MLAKSRDQKEQAQVLVSQLKDPLKSQLLALLKQGQKIGAIKQYQSSTGADLTTAVQVIDALQTTATS
jgi:ribosomal protein L7/L12